MTFIRNEVKKTSIHHKNEHFVTNLITNFWLIVIVLKVTKGGIYHEYQFESETAAAVV